MSRLVRLFYTVDTITSSFYRAESRSNMDQQIRYRSDISSDFIFYRLICNSEKNNEDQSVNRYILNSFLAPLIIRWD